MNTSLWSVCTYTIVYNILRKGETKKNRSNSNDPVHYWFVGVSTREKLLKRNDGRDFT